MTVVDHQSDGALVTVVSAAVGPQSGEAMTDSVNEKEAAHTPAYEVSRDGRVYSLESNWRGYGRREMRQTPNADGYPSVRLKTSTGRRTRLAVHRLVAKHYLPPRPSPSHEIRHLDGDKMNPHADNLAWGTRKENADDRERHGRTSRGVTHSEAIKRGKEAAHVQR